MSLPSKFMKKLPIIMLGLLVALPLTVLPALAADYTSTQVATHNTSADCWAIVNSKVYNLTSYIASHPGGQAAIAGLCGTNASAAFATKHGATTGPNTALAGLYVGALVVSDTIVPNTPTNLAASLNASNKVVLSWTAATDNVGIAGYKIMKAGSLLATSTSNSYVDTSIVASSTYSYYVTAFDAVGNTSGTSNAVSITVLSSSDTVVPSTTTNLTVKQKHNKNRIVLSWANATDNMGVIGYKIMRNGSLIATSTHSRYIDTTTATSTSYTYAVTAYDAAGNTSVVSNVATITTKATNSKPVKAKDDKNKDHGDKHDDKDKEDQKNHKDQNKGNAHSHNDKNDHGNNVNSERNDD